MRKRVNPKDWGIKDDTYDRVPKLGPPPEKVKQVVEKFNKAWKAWDASMVVSDKDRELADRVFDKVRKQETKDE